jgi:hypothetical protein
MYNQSRSGSFLLVELLFDAFNTHTNALLSYDDINPMLLKKDRSSSPSNILIACKLSVQENLLNLSVRMDLRTTIIREPQMTEACWFIYLRLPTMPARQSFCAGVAQW